MKQNITSEQLEELSPKAKEKLREWWKPQEHDLYFDGEINTWEQDMDGCIAFDDVKKATALGGDEKPEWDKAYPLLSIGQMIEFLDEHKEIVDIQPAIHFTQKQGDGDFRTIIGKTICWHNNELCDALWESVKQILEESNG